MIVGHPNAELSFTSSSGCVPFTINLNSASGNISFYSWAMGTGDTIVGNPAAYTYLNPGQYSITLTVVDSNLCEDDTTYNYINVFPVPEADFDFTQSPLCSLPSVISFTNQSTGASSFNWTFGSLGQSTTQDPVLPVTSPVTIPVSLTSVNVFGCSATIQKNVKVYGNPVADFTPIQSQGCDPFTVLFNSTSTNASSATWYFGTGDTVTGSSVIYTYNQPGVYPVTLIADEDSICFDTLTVSGSVVVLNSPVADFSLAPVDTLFDPSGIYQFTNGSIDAVRWEWDFGDGTSAVTAANPMHRFTNNGTYYVTLIAYASNDCPDTIVYPVEVDYLGSLFIPNAFSPDAGTDETGFFIPRGAGLAEFLIEVFSPYGEKVWSSDKLLNGQPTEKWDGTFQSRPLPQGAYVWKVEAIFQNGQVWKGMSYEGEKPKRVGSLMIIR